MHPIYVHGDREAVVKIVAAQQYAKHHMGSAFVFKEMIHAQE
jgi:hypothetical protein